MKKNYYSLFFSPFAYVQYIHLFQRYRRHLQLSLPPIPPRIRFLSSIYSALIVYIHIFNFQKP